MVPRRPLATLHSSYQRESGGERLCTLLITGVLATRKGARKGAQPVSIKVP